MSRQALTDCLFLASKAQHQIHLVSRGQIVSADPPLLTDGQTHNLYHINTSITQCLFGAEPECKLMQFAKLEQHIIIRNVTVVQ